MRNFSRYFDEDILNAADSDRDFRLVSSFLLLVVSIIIRLTNRLLRDGDSVGLAFAGELSSFSFIFCISLHLWDSW